MISNAIISNLEHLKIFTMVIAVTGICSPGYAAYDSIDSILFEAYILLILNFRHFICQKNVNSMKKHQCTVQPGDCTFLAFCVLAHKY